MARDPGSWACSACSLRASPAHLAWISVAFPRALLTAPRLRSLPNSPAASRKTTMLLFSSIAFTSLFFSCLELQPTDFSVTMFFRRTDWMARIASASKRCRGPVSNLCQRNQSRMNASPELSSRSSNALRSNSRRASAKAAEEIESWPCQAPRSTRKHPAAEGQVAQAW